jgi:hypothetical protein
MKKIILLAAFGVAGLVSAKSTEIKTETREVNTLSLAAFFYHPIKLTSSCGYTEFVEVGPNDAPDCYLLDLQQMEDECAAPFTNSILAGMW